MTLATPVSPFQVEVDPDEPCGTRNNSLGVGNTGGARVTGQPPGPVVTTGLDRRIRLPDGEVHPDSRIRTIKRGRDLDQRGAVGAIRDASPSRRVARLVGGTIGVRVADGRIIDANSRGVADPVRAAVGAVRALVHALVGAADLAVLHALRSGRAVVRISHTSAVRAKLASSTIGVHRALVNTGMGPTNLTKRNAFTVIVAVVRVVDAHMVGAKLASGAKTGGRTLVDTRVAFADQAVRAIAVTRALGHANVGGADLVAGAVSVARALRTTGVVPADRGITTAIVAVVAPGRIIDTGMTGVAELAREAIVVHDTLEHAQVAFADLVVQAVAITVALDVASVVDADVVSGAIAIAAALDDAGVAFANLVVEAIAVTITFGHTNSINANLGARALTVLNTLDVIDTLTGLADLAARAPIIINTTGDAVMGLAHKAEFTLVAGLATRNAVVRLAHHSTTTLVVGGAIRLFRGHTLVGRTDLATRTTTVDSASGNALMERAHFADFAVGIGTTAGEAVAVRAILGSQALGVGVALVHIFAGVVGADLAVAAVAVRVAGGRIPHHTNFVNADLATGTITVESALGIWRYVVHDTLVVDTRSPIRAVVAVPAPAFAGTVNAHLIRGASAVVAALVGRDIFGDTNAVLADLAVVTITVLGALWIWRCVFDNALTIHARLARRTIGINVTDDGLTVALTGNTAGHDDQHERCDRQEHVFRIHGENSLVRALYKSTCE